MDVSRLDRCHVCECGGGGEAGRGEALQGEIEENLESEVGFSSGGFRSYGLPPPQSCVACQFKNSYGPAFSRISPLLEEFPDPTPSEGFLACQFKSSSDLNPHSLEELVDPPLRKGLL